MNGIHHRSIISAGKQDSFALEDLLSQAERVTNIIISYNTLSDKQIRSLEKLRDDIKGNRQIDRLSKGSDKKEWNRLLDLDNNHTWLDDYHHGLRISYFHRLLLDKVNYFETNEDPYLKIKRLSLSDSISEISDDYVRNISFDEILDGMLWGNKYDLVPPSISKKKKLVADNRDKLKEYFDEKALNQIDILADNTGQELFFDVLFACYVIENKISKKIIIHLKNYPYNVTDATINDFNYLVAELSGTTRLKNFGSKLAKYIREDKIKPITYPFTTLGYDRKNAANISKTIYHHSSLIVTKGDFNYRKNVGWHYWKISDNYQSAISYLKSPLLCFRVIKNEIMLGINDCIKIDELHQEDPEWWKKGSGGMILFEYPNKNGYDNNGSINSYWERIG